MDRGAWQAAVTKSWMWLKWHSVLTYILILKQFLFTWNSKLLSTLLFFSFFLIFRFSFFGSVLDYQENWGKVQSFPRWLRGKESSCNVGWAGDTGSVSQFGRSPEGGLGNPLQYSCLENPKDKGAEALQSAGCKQLDMTERLSITGQSFPYTTCHKYAAPSPHYQHPPPWRYICYN